MLLLEAFQRGEVTHFAGVGGRFETFVHWMSLFLCDESRMLPATRHIQF